MAIDVAVYNEGILLGTGSLSTATIGSYTGTAPGNGRNVQVVIVADGAAKGKSWMARIVSGSGSSSVVTNVTQPYTP